MSLQGEIKLSVTIEDEANKDLPSAVQLFRPIRQYVYGVLFSLAESRKKAERLAVRKNCLPECESRSLMSLCHVLRLGFFFKSLRGGQVECSINFLRKSALLMCEATPRGSSSVSRSLY